VACLFLVKYFEMPIWHPTSEKALDELLDAEVDVYNVHGLILKKVFVLNKNIVHLIDDIFWNMGFKTETQDLLYELFVIISILSIMHLILIVSNICRFVRILDLQITCGRTKRH